LLQFNGKRTSEAPGASVPHCFNGMFSALQILVPRLGFAAVGNEHGE